MPVMTYNFHPFSGQWRRNRDGTWGGVAGYQLDVFLLCAPGAWEVFQHAFSREVEI